MVEQGPYKAKVLGSNPSAPIFKTPVHQLADTGGFKFFLLNYFLPTDIGL